MEPKKQINVVCCSSKISLLSLFISFSLSCHFFFPFSFPFFLFLFSEFTTQNELWPFRNIHYWRKLFGKMYIGKTFCKLTIWKISQWIKENEDVNLHTHTHIIIINYLNTCTHRSIHTYMYFNFRYVSHIYYFQNKVTESL